MNRGAGRFPSRLDLVDLGAALVTAVLLVTAALGLTGPGRLVLALVFVTFVPGWALLNFLPLAKDATRAALAAALSLSVTTLVAVSTLWLGLWNPRALLNGAGLCCLLALTWRLAHPRPVSS